MKRILIPTICVLFSVGVCFGRSPHLANRGSRGLYSRSIEQILRLKADEVDLATAVLIISEEWNDNVLGRRYISRVDDMARDIRKKLDAKGIESDYKTISVINDYLFKEQKFKSVKEADDPRDLFLHSVMDRKRGYCLSLSVLYLSLGERLGLPLNGVVVPGHFFVRYDDGNQIRFNIETTSNGGTASDEHYLTKFKVPEGDSLYMQNLDKMQTLGCFFNNLGNSYMDVGKVDSARQALERAVEINPTLAESRTNLGNVYLRKGQVREAIREYKVSLDINPNDSKTHNNLGNAYAKQGLMNSAILAYEESIDLDPNFVDAYTNLASAYQKQQMFSKAMLLLKEAISLERKNASLYSQLGGVYSEMGDCKGAIAQYKKALKIDSQSADSYYGMAGCYREFRRVDDAIWAYKKALQFEPDMVAALGSLGNMYFGKEQYDEAIVQYRKALQFKADDSAIYYNLGAAYSNKGNFAKAVQAYVKAISLNPEDGNAHGGLGFAYYRLEDYESAWKHIRAAQHLGVDVAAELVSAVRKEL